MSRPEHIGKYEVLEEIGRGGMGIVYKALHPVLDRYVAIKVLPDYMARQDPEFAKRFLREARIMVDLNHQGIVRVLDADSWKGALYLVMDFVEGWTIRQVMAGTPAQGVQPPFSLSVERTVDILTQVANALGYAHQRGIIHRDIKPSNVLLDKDGHTWITDFGIAKSLSGTTIATQAGVSLGTPEYMAPEQFAESEHTTVDGRSDIYSLGCVVYEMLTGKVPFAGETPLGVAYKHVNLPCPHLRQFNPKISTALESIVLTMLAKDRTERHATCENLLADLQRYGEKEGGRLQAATLQTEGPGPEVVAGRSELGAVPAARDVTVVPQEVTVRHEEVVELERQTTALEELSKVGSGSVVTRESPVGEPATIVSAQTPGTTTEEPVDAESATREWEPGDAPTVVADSRAGRSDRQGDREQPAVQVTESKQSKRRTLVLLGVALALVVLIPVTILLVRGVKPAPTAVIPATQTVSLSITSIPPGAEVFLDGTVIGRTPVQDYQASAGSHTAILNMNGYNEMTATFDLSKGETGKTLSYVLIASSPPTTTTTSSAVDVPVFITSDPSGAKVTVDGASQGVTPLTVSLKAGTYELGVTKDGYKAYQGTVEVLKTDTSRTVPVTLTKIAVTPTTATLTITSTPSGAQVYLDGASIGTTPITRSAVPTGTYALRLTFAGYIDYSASVSLRVGDAKTVTATLTMQPVAPTTGTLTVTSTPSGAEAFLDNASIGTTPITVRTVSPGTHAVRLSLAGYEDYTTSVALQAGSVKTVTGTLTKIAVAPTTVALTVTSAPSGAEVFLNGTSIGTTPLQKTVPQGPHSVRLTLAGYNDYATSVSLQAGDVKTLTANLTKTPVTAAVAIGDIYQGGIVAYILQVGDLGYSATVQHGLIAAPTDQRAVKWARSAYTSRLVPGGTLTTLGSGSANTDKIVAQNGASSTYAAGLARAYNGGGYSDWYLPSKDELNKLYINRVAIGGFADESYWSSSEVDAEHAWAQVFQEEDPIFYHHQWGTYKDSNIVNFIFVRAVRSF